MVDEEVEGCQVFNNSSTVCTARSRSICTMKEDNSLYCKSLQMLLGTTYYKEVICHARQCEMADMQHIPKQ